MTKFPSKDREDEKDKLLYTAKEACMNIYGSDNKQTMNKMYRLLKSGSLEAERVGGTWFIPRKTLVRLHGNDFM